MIEQFTPLWSEAVQRLLKDSNDDSLAAWMKEARPVSVDDECLIVQVPNTFTRDWMSMRYGEAIRTTLHELSGQNRDVRFVVPGAEPAAAAPRRGNGSPTVAAAPYPNPTPSAMPATTPVTGDNHAEAEHQPRQIVLNPRYTFDSFVVGPSNRFAHAACLAVAEAPAEAYNPLFIYGGVGLGKTHLMQAIAQHSSSTDTRRRIVYVSSETFTNELINALQHKSMPAFRAKYRSVDILLIDDIQFIAGKESTQEEFFHTFNALFEVNKQIVISSDRPPRDIPHLEERLRSRFEWGLAADIQPPDFETRTAIIRKKAADEGLLVPQDVLTYIAQQAQSNIRELEGALTRVVAYARTVGLPLSVDVAAEALRDIIAAQRPQPVSINTIQDCVARYFGLRTTDLTSRARSRNIAFPRQIAMYLARTMTDSSLPAIGEAFGGRDHTTVMHGCERVREQLASDHTLAATIEELKQLITNSG